MQNLEEKVTLRRQTQIWTRIGLQSFGGGAATLALVRRAVIDEEKWLTEEEFTQFWSICQIVPGVNMIALTILIGSHVGGARGTLVALGGLLIPSVAVTIVISAGFVQFEKLRAGREMVRGIVPATVGLGLITAWQMVRTPLQTSLRKSPAFFALDIGLLLGSGAAITWLHWPVMGILCIAGLIAGIANGLKKQIVTP